MATTYLRFADLKAGDIVTNWHTLAVWIKTYEGFPPGIKLGGNTRAWREDEVEGCGLPASQVETRGLTAKGDHVVGWIDDGVDQSGQSV